MLSRTAGQTGPDAAVQERSAAPAQGAAGAHCRQCGAALCADEIALTKKLINRGAGEYLCLPCLADFFGCSTDRLRQKIEQFRRDGCTLFAPLPKE